MNLQYKHRKLVFPLFFIPMLVFGQQTKQIHLLQGKDAKQIEANQFRTVTQFDNSRSVLCKDVNLVDVVKLQKAVFQCVIDQDGQPGNEHFSFRVRLDNSLSNNVIGFSLLLDIDNAFGNDGNCEKDDPNAVAGNMGFEIEIKGINEGRKKGLYLNDIDGTTTGNTRVFYPINSDSKKSEVMDEHACNIPRFYDFTIPVSDLSTWFGIKPTTPLRLVFVTHKSEISVYEPEQATASNTNYLSENIVVDNTKNDAKFVSQICSQTATSLPTELFCFKAEKLDMQVLMSWTTVSEDKNDYFVIEKSADRINFEIIAELEAVGNSDMTIQYGVIDFNPFIGTNFYRLKQIDFNGKHVYSGIVEVNFDDRSNFINTYHNSIDNKLYFNKKPDYIEIFDSMGNLVISNPPINPTLSLNSLNGGIYYAIIQNNGQNQYKKLVIE